MAVSLGICVFWVALDPSKVFEAKVNDNVMIAERARKMINRVFMIAVFGWSLLIS